MPNTSPPELMQLLLSTTLKGNTNTFLNFQERFQSLIDQSPSLLHSVGKDGYFVAFFFGAFASFLDSGLANIDPSTQVQNIFFRFDKHNNLKLAVLVHEESLHKLLCMNVSETNQTLTFDDDELKNIDWQIATTNRATRLRYEVIAYNLAIDKKTYKALLHEVEKPKLKLNSNQGTKPFTRIVSLKPNLEQSIRELSDSKNINKAMSQVLEHIVKTYKHYSNENSAVTKFFENEARDHGYVAGIFTNFKYRQHLKLYSEIFEGKGQADLVLLVRGHTKSSNSIPVIIEMKAGTSDNSQIAVGQAKAYVKGRFYNFIRILTTNKQVLCVGLNLHFNHHANYSFYATSCIERKGNSIIEKFLSDSRRNPLNAQIIREQLEYLYYGIVWSNGGNSNDRYMSRFILGQSVFIPDTGSHKCIFVYSENEKMQEGTIQRPRDSEKKMKDHVTTIILIDGSKAFILNINELQAGLKSKNDIIPIEQINKEVNIIYEISCNLVGAPNNSNPFHRYCADGAITVTKHNSLDKYRDIKERAFDGTIKPLNNNIEFQNAFNTAKNSGQYNDYKKVFKVVAELLAPFKERIANEGEFQAVLHGLFSSYIAEDVRVFTEFQVGSGGETRGVGKEGKKGKLDMVLVVYSNPPVGIELKFATTEESLKQKVKEAEKDLEAYAQATAYKIITDTEQVKLMYAVFNASAQNADSLIKVSENFKDALVSHSSEAMMRLTSNAPQSTTQNRGR